MVDGLGEGRDAPPTVRDTVKPYNAQDTDSHMTLTAKTSYPSYRVVCQCGQWHWAMGKRFAQRFLRDQSQVSYARQMHDGIFALRDVKKATMRESGMIADVPYHPKSDTGGQTRKINGRVAQLEMITEVCHHFGTGICLFAQKRDDSGRPLSY